MPLPSRAAVRKLADEIASGAIDPARAIDEALDAANTDRAIALMVAAHRAAKPPSPAQVGRALPMVDEIEALPILVGCAAGDRAKMLADAVDKDQMGAARDALALFMAAASVDGAAPARIGALLRREARRSEKPDTAAMILAAARTLGDVDVVASVCAVLPYIDLPLADEATRRWRAEMAKSPIDALPEEAARVVASGFTARRAVPKVGRNDPCPCGSGKKYKKCHEGKDDLPMEGAIVERLKDAASSLTSDQILDMRPQELLKLDMASLASKPLEQAFKRVTLLHQWDVAERVLDEIGKRTDLDPVDKYRDDLIYEALFSNNAEMARKHAAKMKDASKLTIACKVGLELVSSEPGALANVDAMVAEALRKEDVDAEPLLSLADAMLIHKPAIGIVFARGALNPSRDRLSASTLEAIEEARDRLELAPGDPASAIYDAMLDVDVAKKAKRELAAARAAEKKRAQSQGAALRKKAREAAARVEELESQLRAQQEALAKDEREAAKARVAPSAADDEERRRLRMKIDELKGQIAEGNRERGELRKELAQKSEAVAATNAEDEEEEEEPDIEGVPADVRVRGVAIPRFAKNASEAFRDAPARIARDALLIVAELAAGDAAAWGEVKQLEKARTPIFSARVGIHYRMLFRTDTAGMEVLELFHRKNLESTVKRYA